MNISKFGTYFASGIYRRRYLYVGIFLLSVLLIVELFGYFLQNRVENEWESLKIREKIRETGLIQERFQSLQHSLYQIASTGTRRIARLSDRNEKLDRVQAFNTLRRIVLNELQGIEFVSPDGTPISWSGKIPEWDINLLNNRRDDKPVSFVSEGNVFSTLSISIPLLSEENTLAGYVIAHEAFDIRYRLSPRFILLTGLGNKLEKELGKPVRFHFNETAPSENNVYAVSIHDVEGDTIGYAVTGIPTIGAYHSRLNDNLHLVRIFLIGLLSILLTILIFRTLRNSSFPIIRVIGVILFIWIIRYLWFYISFPSDLIGGVLFDPAHYASPYGWGILSSPGELFITVICLIATALLLFYSVIIKNSLQIPDKISTGGFGIAVSLSFVIFLLYILIIHGYALWIRSLIFDATVDYTEPGSILPSPMLAVMQLNVLSLTTAFIIIGTILGSIAIKISVASFGSNLNKIVSNLAVTLFSTLLIYINSPLDPAINIWYYIAVPAILIAITILVQRGYLQAFSLFKIRSILFLSVLAVLIAAPVLDRYIHKFDKERIQLLAERVIRPDDTWKEFLIRETLGEMTQNSSLIGALGTDDREALADMAFLLWAESLLSREGYDAVIKIIDGDGVEVGRFTVGFQTGGLQVTEEIDAAGMINRSDEDIIHYVLYNARDGRLSVYSGKSGIHDIDGEFIGEIALMIFSGPAAFLGGEYGDIVAGRISDDIFARYGKLILSEYRDGYLSFTTGYDIPLERRIPKKVEEIFGNYGNNYLWVNEIIGGNKYESLYFNSERSDLYFAVSLPKLNIAWHIFNALKLLVFALIICTGIIIGIGVLSYFRGKRYQPTFKEKILIGLISIALIPIIIIAYLNREFTLDQVDEFLTNQLTQDTRRLTDDLSGLDEWALEGLDARVLLGKISSDSGFDFFIYKDKLLYASSRPEFLEAQLIDKRISGFAYSNVILQGKQFITQEEAIGESLYLVGYRPVFDSDGSIAAVVAIPAIYRQTEIINALARRNVYLMSIYSLVIIGVIGAGIVVSKRIAHPIEQLTLATRRVAEGDLDITLREEGDSEIVNLMHSFTEMTKKLKENREELARIERELAWKEMARQVAHEIKNPLTPMKLSIQQLKQAHTDKSDEFRKMFDEVTEMLLEQIATLGRIASEFSRFARMPEPKYDATDVNSVLKRAVNLFPKMQGIDFRTDYEDNIPMIYADPEELQRSFVNIIRNGIQAMPEGGILIIKTESAVEKERRAVRIIIADTGTGLAPEARKKLFQPYFSTKTDGMGLGLAIVKRTIEDLKGEIEIITKEHEGTTVIITLPVRTTS